MTDDADAIARKLQKARTDAAPLPHSPEELDGRPEARNLVDIYAGLADVTPADVLREHGGTGWGAFKPRLADLAVERLGPVSAEMARLMADPAEIDRTLAHGAERAREIAAPVLARTYEIVGMVR